MGLALVILTVFSTEGAEPVESVEVRVPEGTHPRVCLTLDEVDAVRARAEAQPWAKAIRDKTLKEAAGLLAEPLDIPHKEGQWSHWYTCKEDGVRLRTESPTKHVCPKCGAVYTGWPYDAVHVARRHGHWFRAVHTLGVAYLFDPKPAYGERARDILLEYASFYRDLKLHNVHNKDGRSGARLCAQTLGEATRLCPMILGYDLLHDAPCFTAEDHQTIEEGLLRPMVETIKRHRAGLSNWQSWHNAAIALVGLFLADDAMVELAINDPENGFVRQMRDSVLDSGMWFEGSPSYHWYALRAHIYLLEAASRAGMDLYQLPKVKGLFDAPLRQLFPDQTFPAMHDSDRGSIKGARPCYETAYRRFGEPNYAALMQPRDTDWGLLWGTDTAPEGSPELELVSSNSEAEGLAILRDTTAQTAVFVDYSQRGGGHIHPCRLNLILFAHGDERLVDPGRLAYGNPMHKRWFRQTIAHNTVVVNESSQTNVAGTLKAFAAEDGWALIRAECPKAYKGVNLDRTVLLRDSVVVDVFRCTADKEVTFDLPLHFRGALEELPASESIEQLSESPGYRELKDVKRLTETLKNFSVGTREGARIFVQAFDESEAFIAQGYGKKMQELLPMVLRRQRGARADFVTVYHLLEAGASPAEAACTLGGDITVRFGGTEMTVGQDTGDLHVPCALTIDGKRREL